MTIPKFTGVWIPAQVFQSSELSNTAKLLYGVVAGLDGQDGCYASNAYLQTSLNQGERAIQVVLKQLEDAGLIVREEINGKRIIRTVEGMALVGCKKLRGGVNKNAGEGCKKMHPYNKEDNKEDKTTPTPSSESDIPWADDKEVGPMPFSSDEFRKTWALWIEYRKEMKKPLRNITTKAQLSFLKKLGEKDSIASIHQSITNGWSGLFTPHGRFNTNRNTKILTDEDHKAF